MRDKAVSGRPAVETKRQGNTKISSAKVTLRPQHINTRLHLIIGIPLIINQRTGTQSLATRALTSPPTPTLKMIK
jgi:hypothetical protein